jgi:VWFA-related protein
MTTSRWLAVFGAVAAMPLGAQQPTFKTAVSLVRVDVLATDHGRPIPGLTGADFELLDSGVPQVIDVAAGEKEALDVFLVLDTSQSVQGPPLDHLQDAVKGIIEGLRAPDRAELLTFSNIVKLRVGLTNDMTALRRAVSGIDARGGTSLLDALYIALTHNEKSPGRSMVLVFSDGLDNYSWLAADQVRDIARETEAVIYAVAYKPRTVAGIGKDADEPDQALLRDIASATGGQLVLERESSQFRSAFTRFLLEMRSRYLLSYYPRGVPGVGWHSLQVRLKGRSGRISARPGYMVAK